MDKIAKWLCENSDTIWLPLRIVCKKDIKTMIKRMSSNGPFVSSHVIKMLFLKRPMNFHYSVLKVPYNLPPHTSSLIAS